MAQRTFRLAMARDRSLSGHSKESRGRQPYVRGFFVSSTLITFCPTHSSTVYNMMVQAHKSHALPGAEDTTTTKAKQRIMCMWNGIYSVHPVSYLSRSWSPHNPVDIDSNWIRPALRSYPAHRSSGNHILKNGLMSHERYGVSSYRTVCSTVCSS